MKILGIGRTCRRSRRSILDCTELRLAVRANGDERILHGDGPMRSMLITVGTCQIVGIKSILGDRVIKKEATYANYLGLMQILIDQHYTGLTVKIRKIGLTKCGIDGADVTGISHIIGRHRRFERRSFGTRSEKQ